MREPTITTVADLLFWAYANNGMAEHAVHHGAAQFQQPHYVIRNRLWSGLRRGQMKPASPVKDLRTKLNRGRSCAYCGSSRDLSVDHLIPTANAGRETADNIVLACRPCNRSKGDLDVLDWYHKKNAFPPLFILRVYLKEAIRYCHEQELMQLPWVDVKHIPFSLASIPLQYPAPEQLVYYPHPQNA